MENSKIDEQQYNNNSQTHDEKLLDVHQQNEKEQVNTTYYVSSVCMYLYLLFQGASVTAFIKGQ